MSRPRELLGPGDPVFHPRYGLGTVHSLTRYDRIQRVGEPTPAAGAGGTEDYYDIELVEGGTLRVPVGRAESVGLRRASNGVETVKANLRSSPEELPADARERAAVLRTREQNGSAEALACSVRDLVVQSRGRTLSATERNWLEKACQRLSLEAALVDQVSVAQARAEIWEVVTELRAA